MDRIQSFYESAEAENQELQSEIPENVRQSVIRLNCDWLKLRVMTTEKLQGQFQSVLVFRVGCQEGLLSKTELLLTCLNLHHVLSPV